MSPLHLPECLYFKSLVFEIMLFVHVTLSQKRLEVQLDSARVQRLYPVRAPYPATGGNKNSAAAVAMTNYGAAVLVDTTGMV